MLECGLTQIEALIDMVHSSAIKTGSAMWIFQPLTTLLNADAELWLEMWVDLAGDVGGLVESFSACTYTAALLWTPTL